ncbi:MAG: indolepyruvate oxidoreductase subunit beta [Candidatus Saccharibacteria bacterium]
MAAKTTVKNDVMNILIVGVGGQGTLLASRIIAQAAIQMGHDVKVSEIHGMAQRGGSVVSQVRYGNKVFSPIIKKGEADVILAFEKLEAARYLDFLRKGGSIIINDDRIDPAPVMSGDAKYPEKLEEKIASVVPRTIVIDATSVAKKCGNVKAANTVLVGVMGREVGIPDEALEEAINKVVPAKAREVNQKALAAGRDFRNKKKSK